MINTDKANYTSQKNKNCVITTMYSSTESD